MYLESLSVLANPRLTTVVESGLRHLTVNCICDLQVAVNGQGNRLRIAQINLSSDGSSEERRVTRE